MLENRVSISYSRSICLIGMMVVALWGILSPSYLRSDDQSGLIPSTREARDANLARAVQSRQKLVSSLIQVLREPIPEYRVPNFYIAGDVKWYAIEMLAHLRAGEAVQALLDCIDFQMEIATSLSQGVVDRQMIRALVSIGKPASRGAVDYLAKDKSKDRAKMYVRVIAEVEGMELGKEMVRFAAEKEPDPAKKARLKESLELFKDAGKKIP